MRDIRISDIIKTSVVTAFTIATALIWKDVIIEGIAFIVPNGEVFFYKLIAAFAATIVIVIFIYIWLRTESKAESYVLRFRNRKKI